MKKREVFSLNEWVLVAGFFLVPSSNAVRAFHLSVSFSSPFDITLHASGSSSRRRVVPSPVCVYAVHGTFVYIQHTMMIGIILEINQFFFVVQTHEFSLCLTSDEIPARWCFSSENQNLISATKKFDTATASEFSV